MSGRCKYIVAAASLATLIGCGDGGGHGNSAELHLGDVQVALGQDAAVCVTMTGGEDRIAGLQMNLLWDDTCITPTDARQLCRANPASGKNVQAALQGRGVLKAILISFSDVEPIPDGPLFCCNFTAVGAEGDECLVEATAVIGSTATGVRINGIEAVNAAVVSVLCPISGPC